MSGNSKIEWTDASWSPIRARVVAPDGTILKWGYHCEKVSPGCAHCYAEIMNGRGFPHWGTRLDYKPGLLDAPLPAELCAELGYPEGARLEMYLDDDALTWPLRKRKPQRIFLSSMTDVFARFGPDEWLDKIFAVMALAKHHTFQVLTKRAERMRDYCRRRADDWMRHIPQAGTEVCRASGQRAARHTEITLGWPLPNVWLGVSVEDQPRADERIPLLLDTPAALRWISAEPLLGPVDLQAVKHISAEPDEFDNALVAFDSRATLDWVVVGGESGANARPMHPDWARALRDQCEAAGVPFFFKQWGEWKTLDPKDPKPDKWYGERIGKKAAGRTLDGRTHDAFPGASAEATAKADRTHDAFPGESAEASAKADRTHDALPPGSTR